MSFPLCYVSGGITTEKAESICYLLVIAMHRKSSHKLSKTKEPNYRKGGD